MRNVGKQVSTGAQFKENMAEPISVSSGIAIIGAYLHVLVICHDIKYSVNIGLIVVVLERQFVFRKKISTWFSALRICASFMTEFRLSLFLRLMVLQATCLCAG